jgi:hypothetical protein
VTSENTCQVRGLPVSESVAKVTASMDSIIYDVIVDGTINGKEDFSDLKLPLAKDASMQSMMKNVYENYAYRYFDQASGNTITYLTLAEVEDISNQTEYNDFFVCNCRFETTYNYTFLH